MKFQLSINIGKSADKNSASTKAVKDCIQLFSSLGYQDYNLFYSENTNSALRYLYMFRALCKLYFKLPKGALVGVQYPMLNNIFKYFIKLGRQKGVRFFCIIHDIESLRLGGQDTELVKREVANLNYYDCLIVHNDSMMRWLTEKGITKKMIPLGLFDYLMREEPVKADLRLFSKSIVFAGNLAKSNFIYSVDKISNWKFRVYGPNYKKDNSLPGNLDWAGEFSPDEVVYKLNGDFGLIWDGDSIEKCDAVLGNYLKYNNPHKFSLYLAAGLPVVAPKNSAIGKMIAELKLGLLVEDLGELDSLQLDAGQYENFRENCKKVKNQVTKGEYFIKAVGQAERYLKN